MSAQMVTSSGNPGATDDMKLLEEQAKKVAETAHEDQPKQKTMTFVKYVIAYEQCKVDLLLS